MIFQILKKIVSINYAKMVDELIINRKKLLLSNNIARLVSFYEKVARKN